jgi:hypothetical protein
MVGTTGTKQSPHDTDETKRFRFVLGEGTGRRPTSLGDLRVFSSEQIAVFYSPAGSTPVGERERSRVIEERRADHRVNAGRLHD